MKRAGTQKHSRHEKARAARFLLRGAAALRRSADDRRVLLESVDGGAISIDGSNLKSMMRDGLVHVEGERLSLSSEGRAFVSRIQAPEDPFRAQHQVIGTKAVEVDGEPEPVTANLTESPLARLARQRTRTGERFLSADEVNAGERLRSDYTRGHLMPRMGANWQAAVSSGKRDGGAGGVAELTDAALAARQRVNLALEAVGPELSGVLVDVCCYLKGLECIEAEQGWPVRSGKVVLKTALAALSRHYAPPPAGSGRGASRILHWGDESYRPAITA